MEIEVDMEADAVYITLGKQRKSDVSKEVHDSIIIDYKDGKPVGIEILNVSWWADGG